MVYLESKMIGVVVAILGVANFIAYAQEKAGKVDYKAEGKVKLEQGEYVEAIVSFDKYLQQNPDDFEAFYLMANAKGGLKFAGVKVGDAWEVDIPYEIKKDIKNKFWAETDFKKVIELCNQAISASPKDEKAYFYRGLVEEIGISERDTSKKDEIYGYAIVDFSKVIELNPKNAEAYYNRGSCKYQLKQSWGTMEDLDKAIEDLDKAIELNPKYAEAYYKREIVREVKGDKIRSAGGTGYIEYYKSAVEDWDKCIELKPNNWMSYKFRAFIKENRLNDYKGAIEDYEKAKELAPGKRVISGSNATDKEFLQDDIDRLKKKLEGSDSK